MPVLEKVVNFEAIQKIADTKTFNNMSLEEGFEWPYAQYNSSIYLLEACYELLEEAGFTNIAKDVDAQSLDVWGLKLFFVNTYNGYVAANVCEAGCAINIAAPGVDYPYYATNRYGNNNYNYIPPLCNRVKRNHFLQSSVVDKYTDARAWAGGNHWQEYMYNKTVDVSEGYHSSVKINKTNNVYSFAVVLRCSSNNIIFTVQKINNSNNSRGVEQPLFNIFKGRDVVNDKEILVLGKTLERAPFFLDIDTNVTESHYSAYHYFTNKSYITNYADGNTNEYVGMSGVQLLYPYYSALICSGNNIIYHTDDLYTPLKDTLYLDWKMNKNNDARIVEKGNAYANSGKYMLYGVNEIIANIPVSQGNYYDLDEEKYWCKNNVLTTEYGCNANIAYNDFLNAGNSTTGYNCNNRILALDMTYNLFGRGAYDFVNISNGTYLQNRDKKTVMNLLNPAILIRVDDEIIEE